jgi:hypothetical protein
VSLSYNGTLNVVRRAPRLFQSEAAMSPPVKGLIEQCNKAMITQHGGITISGVLLRVVGVVTTNLNIAERHEVVRTAPQQATSGWGTNHVTNRA